MPTGHRASTPTLRPTRASKQVVTTSRLRIVSSNIGPTHARSIELTRHLIRIDFILARRAAAAHMAKVIDRMNRAFEEWAATL
jgi:hypothetical protein